MILIVFSINPSIILIYPFSSGEQKEKAIPDFPALPVLPILWIYVSGMFGIISNARMECVNAKNEQT